MILGRRAGALLALAAIAFLPSEARASAAGASPAPSTATACDAGGV